MSGGEVVTSTPQEPPPPSTPPEPPPTPPEPPPPTLRQRLAARTTSLRDRITLNLDRWLVGGYLRAIVLLALAAVVVALLAGWFSSVTGVVPGTDDPRKDAPFWAALVRTLDPGQIMEDQGWYRVEAIVITVLGLLFISTLISIVNNRFERRVEKVRSGRLPVRPHRQEDHYLILGWSEITLKVVQQLARSTASDKAPPIVVVASRPHEQMTREFDESMYRIRRSASRTSDASTSELRHHRGWPQFVTGNPQDTRDLVDLARLDRARAVIVLAESQGYADASVPGALVAGESLADVVKTTIAVDHAVNDVSADRTRGEQAKYPSVVVEVPEGESQDAVARTQVIATLEELRCRPQVIDVGTLMSNMEARAVARPDLVSLFLDLLDFDGYELRIVPHARVPADKPELFGELQEAVSNASLLGFVSHSDPKESVDGELAPEWDEPRDQRDLVVLSRGEPVAFDGPRPRSADRVGPGDAASAPGCVGPCERVTIVGWNARTSTFVQALRDVLGADIPIRILVPDGVDRTGLDEQATNVAIDALLPDLMSSIDSLTGEVGPGERVVIVADERLHPSVADAQTMLIVLALRGQPIGQRRVIAELRERSNRHILAAGDDEVARSSEEFIVGDTLVALLAAQYAVQPQVAWVLRAFVAVGGAEIDLVDTLPPSGNNDDAERIIRLGYWCPRKRRLSIDPSPTSQIVVLRRTRSPQPSTP